MIKLEMNEVALLFQMLSEAQIQGKDAIVVGKLLEQKKKTHGYDAQSEEYCDMFAKGIIDPVKVVRTALQDAASIAGLLKISHSLESNINIVYPLQLH